MSMKMDLTCQLTGGFYPDTWHKMVSQAATSRDNEDKKTHQHICKVLYPDGAAKLELKTDQKIQEHYQTHGKWSSICAKLQFSEVINLSRMNIDNRDMPLCSLLHKPPELSLDKALDKMTERAEKKYNSGFLGSIRKVLSAISNIFTGNEVSLFGGGGRRGGVAFNNLPGKLPFFIGNNVQFAHLVTEQLREPAPKII